jgi:hypothetical protein
MRQWRAASLLRSLCNAAACLGSQVLRALARADPQAAAEQAPVCPKDVASNRSAA